MELPIARAQRTEAEQGASFYYSQWGPVTTEISSGWELGPPGVSWSRQVEPEHAGYYRASLNVRKISGNIRNVEIYAGTSSNIYSASGNHVSGVVYYDPESEFSPWIAIQASMNLEGSSALIEVSGFICTWT